MYIKFKKWKKFVMRWKNILNTLAKIYIRNFNIVRTKKKMKLIFLDGLF